LDSENTSQYNSTKEELNLLVSKTNYFKDETKRSLDATKSQEMSKDLHESFIGKDI
jgi:hypothetical protein